MKCISLWILLLGLSDLGFASDEIDSLDVRLQWEYQRINSKSIANVQRLTLKIARWYKHNGEISQARDELVKYTGDSIAPNLLVDYCYELALTGFLTDSFRLALANILLIDSVNETEPTDELKLLKILALNSLGQYQNAKIEMLEFLKHHHLDSTEVLLAYSEAEKARFKSPKTANNLSTLLPGAGLIYSKKIENGIISAMLNTGFIGYAVFHALAGYYATAALTGIGFFLRFYSGSKRASVYHANLYNDKLKTKINKKLNGIVLQHFSPVMK